MIKRLFWVIALFSCLSAVVHADGNSCATNAAAIIKIFDQGVVLNEKFKKVVEEEDKATYQSLRAQLEELNEVEVIPCVERAGEILSEKDESELAHKLLQLVVSYENSADETISYSLGLVFGRNPQVLENAIKRFSLSEQKLIGERLSLF